jgi:signal-transduction protein with cAMP-binding, CBS, and nucleotidyltransferase domain
MDRQAASFGQSLKVRLENVQESTGAFTEKKVLAYIKEVPFFRSIVEEKLYKLARVAKVRTYFENDQIIMNHELGMMYFLLEGRVVRLMDPGSGWYNMLDIAKEGKILNETVIMDTCKSRIMGEVISEKARILVLPLPHIMDMATESYALRKTFFLHVIGEMEKYQRRWVSS